MQDYIRAHVEATAEANALRRELSSPHPQLKASDIGGDILPGARKGRRSSIKADPDAVYGGASTKQKYIEAIRCRAPARRQKLSAAEHTP